MEVAQNELDPELEKIYSDLENEIDLKIKFFWYKKQNEIEKSIKSMAGQSFGPTYRLPSTSKQVAATSSPGALQTPSQPKSLPWFAGGVKGFLRKLWHGDSASNPDWKWNSVKESFSINEYVFIKSEIENILFETETLENDEIKNLVSSIMISVKSAVEKTKKHMLGKSNNDFKYEKNIKNKRKYERKTGTVETEPAELPVEPTAEPTQSASELPVEPTKPASELPAEPTPQVNQETPKQKIGNLKTSRKIRKLKKTLQDTPSLSIDEMKMDNEKASELAKNLNNIVNDELSQYMNGRNSTKAQQEAKKAIEQQIIQMLSDSGIEMTGKGYVASTEANVVKLVQILKELGDIESYSDWTDVESYHSALPGLLSTNTDSLIEKTIKMFKEKQSEDDMAEPPAHESFNTYLNNKNKLSIKEKRDLFKNLIKENNSYYSERIALNRIKDKKEKIKFIKNLIHC